MDHKPILGTEPSSVILRVVWKLKSDTQKVPNQAQAKGMVWKIHKITISVNFNSENFDAFKTPRINQSRP